MWLGVKRSTSELTQAQARGCCPGGSGCLDALAGPSQTWPAISRWVHVNAHLPTHRLYKQSSKRTKPGSMPHCLTSLTIREPSLLVSNSTLQQTTRCLSQQGQLEARWSPELSHRCLMCHCRMILWQAKSYPKALVPMTSSVSVASAALTLTDLGTLSRGAAVSGASAV
jgi:hypothetical protein